MLLVKRGECVMVEYHMMMGYRILDDIEKGSR